MAEKLEKISWHVNEYAKHERSKRWYMIAISTALVLMMFSFFTGNFLFAVIIMIVSLIVIMHDGNEPGKVDVVLSGDGIVIGRKYYDYDELKNFSVVFKPKLDVKRLYLEFNNTLRHRVSVSLNEQDPLQIRDFLLKYLEEDLDRTDAPLSEQLAKLFKL